MKARWLVLAFIIPFALLWLLYGVALGPRMDHPVAFQAKMRGGQHLTIVFFGDSITAGQGEEDNYVMLFRKYLKNTSAFDRTLIINAGVPGDTAAGGLNRLEANVINNKPDLVFVAFGGNDLLQKVPVSDFETRLRTMVQKIKDQNHADIVLMTTPMFAVPLSEKAVKPYNKAIRKVAEETHVCFLDIHKRWAKEAGWFGSSEDFMQSDRIHPNARGHRLIFEEICKSLEL
jgi:lysophospholipase L1-like esterase